MGLSKKARKRLAGIVWLIFAIPALPFALFFAALYWIGQGAHWCGRQTADRYGGWADRLIEKWFRVDPETEYQEWKDRMAATRPTKGGENPQPTKDRE